MACCLGSKPKILNSKIRKNLPLNLSCIAPCESCTQLTEPALLDIACTDDNLTERSEFYVNLLNTAHATAEPQ